jgi:hypothetical protein
MEHALGQRDALALGDPWALYDNSGAQPRLLDWDEKP